MRRTLSNCRSLEDICDQFSWLVDRRSVAWGKSQNSCVSENYHPLNLWPDVHPSSDPILFSGVHVFAQVLEWRLQGMPLEYISNSDI